MISLTFVYLCNRSILNSVSGDEFSMESNNRMPKRHHQTYYHPFNSNNNNNCTSYASALMLYIVQCFNFCVCVQCSLLISRVTCYMFMLFGTLCSNSIQNHFHIVRHIHIQPFRMGQQLKRMSIELSFGTR